MVPKKPKAYSQKWNIKISKWDVLFKNDQMLCIVKKPNVKLQRYVIIFLWEVIYVHFYNWDRPLDLVLVVYDLIKWSLKLHSRLRTIPHLIYTHTIHKSNVQWMLISFVWLYMFKCDVCVLNHMWIKSKSFLFFLFAFGGDLYHPCFSKKFQIVLSEKHVFWVFSQVRLTRKKFRK